MDDLIAFITARLDEDELIAGCAFIDDGLWGIAGNTSPRAESTVATERGHFQAPGPDEALHIVHYHPARALREIKAKYRIVDDYRITTNACRRVTGAELDTAGYKAMCAGRDALRSCVMALAFAWADHPDYRAEWKFNSGEART